MGFKVRSARKGILAATRLHAALDAISSMHYPEVSASEWTGDDDTGAYYYDPFSGDRLQLVWSPEALVAAVFDHESERSEYDEDEDERDPLQWLDSSEPAVLRAAEHAADQIERLVTAWLWIGVNGHVGQSNSFGAEAHGLDMLRGFLLSPKQALSGEGMVQGWQELSSLSPTQTAIAARLAADAPTTVSRQEATVLLDGDTAVTRKHAEETAAKLAALGVRWQIPNDAIESRQAAELEEHQRRIDNALARHDKALLQATYDGAKAAVDAEIKAGANVDVRTLEGHWKHTPRGDTPLITALKRGHSDIAATLLDGGADATLANSFGQTALHWATRKRAKAIVWRLLSSDASLAADSSGDTPTLHYAAQHGDDELVSWLLFHGADPAATNRAGKTAADWAGYAGHHDMARRLRQLCDD